ncbi:MAG: hypothetical protein WEB67_11350 [Acidimicrobiia bacterium]
MKALRSLPPEELAKEGFPRRGRAIWAGRTPWRDRNAVAAVSTPADAEQTAPVET